MDKGSCATAHYPTRGKKKEKKAVEKKKLNFLREVESVRPGRKGRELCRREKRIMQPLKRLVCSKRSDGETSLFSLPAYRAAPCPGRKVSEKMEKKTIGMGHQPPREEFSFSATADRKKVQRARRGSIMNDTNNKDADT